MHVSNLFYTEPMVRLAERLSRSSLDGRVFFANSGTEANECAIKIARKHARARGISEPEIVSFEGDFHGRSYGALSATPAMARNPDFAPMLPGFRSVPRGDAEAIREAVGESTAAVLIEPIQGEAGVYEIGEEALLAAREACDRSGALLILDEIQTGMGRTGSLWAFQQTPVRPDVLTTAKALGGGLPVGACITTPRRARCSDLAITARPSPVERWRGSRPWPCSRSSTSRPSCAGSGRPGRGSPRVSRGSRESAR